MKIDTNGTALNVAEFGLGRTTLVFLHHMGGSSVTWSEVIRRLHGRFPCLAIDARGAGASSAPATGYATADHVADVMGVIDSLHIGRRYVVVGHSMGGKAAQLLASKRPRGLLGVVLVASAPPTPMAIGPEQREQMLNAYNDRAAVEGVLDHVLLGSPVAPAVREQLIADALRITSQAKQGWVDIGARDDISQAVAAIEVPVAIFAGTEDRVDTPEVVKQHLLPRHPKAQVHWLQGKGHLLPAEAPEELAQGIGEFVAALSR